MNKVWEVKNPASALRESLSRSLKISPITAQLLINRGITDELQASHFLYGDMKSLHNPFLLKDIEKARDRVRRAISNKEKILVYGDYDVDGITGVALLCRVLKYLKADVESYIPNRLEEGYGLNKEAVKFAHKKKIALIITVDCGISAYKEVKLAGSLGIDVIITDHHEIKTDSLPEAYAIMNPLQKECSYPFKHLAGVAIAYKLASVLVEKTSYPIEEHLDLVALGTVSDIAQQAGENRILTKCGLKYLNDTKNQGLSSLIEVSGLKGKDISCGQIGYVLGPRINAMGRIGSPEVALKLLLTDDANEAKPLAERMNTENRLRRRIESKVLEEALDKIKIEVNFKDTRVIVLASRNWHAGVIGIVASRIIDRFYRPTIIISLDGKKGKGSGRSIDGFHLFNAITASKEWLLDFGGHEAACGLVIEEKNIEKFKKQMNEIASRLIKEEHLSPRLRIDQEVTLADIDEKLIKELALLAPFGPKNPKPLFVSKNLTLREAPKKIGKNGFKIWVTDGEATCEAISFKQDDTGLPSVEEKVDLVYTPGVNSWQGIQTIQLDLKDIKTVF